MHSGCERKPGAWHCWLTQKARAMKLRPAQVSAGLRDETAVASVLGDLGAAGGFDFAAAGGRFAGPGRCAGEGAASGFAAAANVGVVSAATGAGGCVA